MIGKAYAPGALVVAHSLRLMRTKHPIVCMVTDDVPAETRAQLLLVYDRLVDVPYISHKARPFASARQTESYGGWVERSFTKWNCLALTEYDRVVLVDADITFVANVDDLFELRPPAACYSLPWAYPWQREGGVANPYLECVPGAEERCDLPHGTRIPAAKIMAALHERAFVGGGFINLLAPSKAKYEQLLALIDERPVYGEGYLVTSGVDEASIAELYAREGTDWTHIHQRYAAIPWKKEWVSRDIRGYHYLGRKPWDMDPDEWSDLADWWRVADRLVARHPALRELFHPAVAEVSALDADSAQLRLTNDLRSLVISAAKQDNSLRRSEIKGLWKEVDNILERWILSMVNSPGTPEQHAPWARVYRRSTLEDGFNNKLAGELYEKRLARSPSAAGELVVAMLAVVEKRLGRLPRPTGARPACADGALSYGSHFRADRAPRLDQLVEIGGCEAAVHVALRYAATVSSGQQWGLPRAHVDHLYDAFRVRAEAFASPLNARLLGKPGAKFCSIFPDTDAAFGSIGDFFAADLAGANWVVNPPFVEELMGRAARKVTEALEPGSSQTFFFIIPAWTDSEAYAVLHGCPFLAAEIRLDRGQYYYEDPSGQRMNTKASSIYFALSTEGLEVRSRLEGALRHIATV